MSTFASSEAVSETKMPPKVAGVIASLSSSFANRRDKTVGEKKRPVPSPSISPEIFPSSDAIESISLKKKRKIVIKPKRSENIRSGRWNKDEHEKFLEGIRLHGKEWKKIANMIDTRSVVQIRTHAQKYFQKLAKRKAQDMKASVGGGNLPVSVTGMSILTSSPGREVSKKSKKCTKKKMSKKASSKSSSKASKKSIDSSNDSESAQVKRTGAAAGRDGVPFKVSLNLSLKLPIFDGGQDTNRENSPTSVIEFDVGGSDPNESMGPLSMKGDASFVSVIEDPPLCNWLNDVAPVEDDGESSSDSVSSTFSKHSALDESNTVYVDTRCGLEGSVLSNLESFDYEVGDMFSVATTRIGGGW